jgi:hypothetical protein
MVTSRVVVPVPSPDQPPNVEFAAGFAVKVTTALLAKLALQVPEATPALTLQLIPSGLLEIVPDPAPVFVTVSVLFAAVIAMVAELSVVELFPHLLSAWHTLTVQVPGWSGVWTLSAITPLELAASTSVPAGYLCVNVAPDAPCRNHRNST